MTVGHVITLAGILFTLGMVGVLSRRNILIILLSVLGLATGVIEPPQPGTLQ